MTTPGADDLSPMKRAIIEIRDLRARLAASEARTHEPIAVIGIGLRFPGGATDPQSFWQQLWTGTDAIVDVPPSRWSVDDLYDPDPDAPGKISTRRGGFIDDVEQFDAAFFGISPREAERMDPQQRLLLEVTWEALEHSGTAPDQLFGSNAGVFLGISNSDYLRMLLADREEIDAYTTTGSALSVAAGRLSYALGIQGPAISIDTACSSSLVAVHLAAQALRNGETDLALAGGANLILAPELSINFSLARMLADDGRCKTFDESADGYVRSEGCAMIVLKRLREAESAGDRILAVIRGSAVTQDGRSGGLTAPNGPSQEKVITAALADAGVHPSEIGYVEAHGTGTPLGDPIEVRALGAALCEGRAHDQPLLLGSVKTNVGHMEAAAGIGGLVKLVLMLQHRAIPPHLHLNRLNPHIAAEGLAIDVPTRAMPWPPPENGPDAHAVRIGGVSAFGLSGTNAHVVVSEAPPAEPVPTSPPVCAPRVLTMSARSPGALHDLAARYEQLLREHRELSFADVAHRSNLGRSHLDHRLAVVASTPEDAIAQLAAGAVGETRPCTGGEPLVAFLFTGHGSHHAAAGATLYAERPVFRAAIDRCAELLADELDRPLTQILFGGGELLEQMRYAQPALFALQYALAELWRSWGVHPALVAGHSAGEYVASVVAGVLDLADGLRIISARGRLMQRLAGEGEMVAVFVAEAQVAEALGRHASDVGIAAVNGPTNTVISGRSDAVRAAVTDLQLDDGEWRRLDISVAAHSPLVEPILDEFESVVRRVALRAPRTALVSSMTGELAGDDITSPAYWRRHLREPVRFAAVLETLRASGCTAFVEIGPSQTLLALGQRMWPDAAATWAPSIRHDRDEQEQLASSVAALYMAGVDIDWASFDDHPAPVHVELPTYPWQHEPYWSPAATAATSRRRTSVWSEVVDAAQRQAEQGPLDLRVDCYETRWRLLDRLALHHMRNAVDVLGLFDEPGAIVRVHDVIVAGQLKPTYAHLAARWLAHLADAGVLVRSGDDGFVATAPLRSEETEALVHDVAAAFTGDEWLIDYVQRCGERLAAVVSGTESALTTLFPGGSYETVDQLYSTWSVPRYFNAIVREAVRAVSDAHRDRVLRVLEIGAGTGGTTAALLPALPGDRTSYTFTDVSDFFLARAADRFSDHTFVHFGILDIEQEPATQGYDAGAYDVVIAANVLHATRDLDATLARVRGLLAPGGVLVAYESTNHPQWFDITTGLIEGWQIFEDGWRGDHPLLAPDVWPDALRDAGFDDVVVLPGPHAPTAILGQSVLIARAPGDAASVPSPGATGSRAASATSAVGARPGAVERPEASALAAALAEALPDERLDVIVDFVRRSVAHVLRIGDASRLQREQPLLDVGFDSLMAIELRNVLTDGLDLHQKLPATLLFDHPNIGAIALHLDHLMRGRSDEPASTDPSEDQPQANSGSATIGAHGVADLSDDEVEALLLQKLAEMTER